DLPRVIRPDLLLLDNEQLAVTELDSVPGGIGLTAWLNETYSVPALSSGSDGEVRGLAKPAVPASAGALDAQSTSDSAYRVVGGSAVMLSGFAGIFGEATAVHLVVSDESATYRPEMEWIAQRLGHSRFQVRNGQYLGFAPGDAVYRFFELFDLSNVSNAGKI